MVANFNQAIASYNKVLANNNALVQNQQAGAASADSVRPEESRGSFLNMVKGYLEKSIEANYAAEELSIKAVRGEADLTEVITAVANAEAALRSVVTVRDRVIRAYEEIIRMPV